METDAGAPRLTRAFFALDPPAAVKAALGAWQIRWLQAWRQSRPEGLHLTLAFLGEMDEASLRRAQALGAAVAARHQSFDVRTAGLGGFPSERAARILWLGFDPCPALDALVADLRRELRAENLPCDPKPFRAHLTLARAGEGGGRVPDRAPEPMAWQVRALTLLRSEGGRYAAIEAWTLG